MAKRIQRVNELLKKELGQILLRKFDFPCDVLVTITGVETSVDLRKAKVAISVMPEKEIRKVLRILNSQIYNIQQKINQKLRMKMVPKIEFCQEKRVVGAAKIEEILEKIKEKENS